MFKSRSTSLILLGVLRHHRQILALAWPGITILALVILFAIYAFIAAGLQTARAFASATAGPVFGHLLLALIDLAAGVLLPQICSSSPGSSFSACTAAATSPVTRRAVPGCSPRQVASARLSEPDTTYLGSELIAVAMGLAGSA